MNKLLLQGSEFVTSFSLCAIVQGEVFKESVQYVSLSLLVLAVRWIAAKVGKEIEKVKKNKKEEKGGVMADLLSLNSFDSFSFNLLKDYAARYYGVSSDRIHVEYRDVIRTMSGNLPSFSDKKLKYNLLTRSIELDGVGMSYSFFDLFKPFYVFPSDFSSCTYSFVLGRGGQQTDPIQVGYSLTDSFFFVDCCRVSGVGSYQFRFSYFEFTPF